MRLETGLMILVALVSVPTLAQVAQRYKPVSNGTFEVQVKDVVRARSFDGGRTRTRSESDVFLTVYVDTKDPCFNWQADQSCFEPPVKGFNKFEKACGVVEDESGKKYSADGGGNMEAGTFCNYIIPKALGPVILRLHGYPEIKLAAQSKTAQIKKKDGQIIVGEIKWLIVLKDKDVKKTEEGSKIKYMASYTLLNGEWIDAIDEKGVHRGNVFVLLSASQEGSPPDDLDVVKSAVGIEGEGAFRAASLSTGGSVFRIGGRSAGPSISKGKLLGHYREDHGKGQIIPSIEISTDKGVVTIPVKEIVEFN